MTTFALDSPRAHSAQEGGNRVVKNWKVWHETLVFDKLNGMSNIELADKYSIGQNHVSVIWTTRQAMEIRQRVHLQVLAERVENFDERRKQACIQAFENMEKFLSNKTLAEKAPFPFMDRSMKAFEVLSETKTPHLPSATVTHITNNTQINVLGDPEKRKHLADGLARALEVENLHNNVTGDSVDGSNLTGK